MYINLNFIFYFIVFCFLISNTNRILGNKKNVGQTALYLIGILFGLVNGTTRSLWGYLMDKIGFKILMFIISIIELFVSCTIYFFADNPLVFVIENILVACCLSGTTLLIPLFHKIFGKEFGAELYGITGIFIGLASLAGPLLIKIIVKEDEDYLTVYIIGGALCFLKTIALICFKENNPYIFEYKTRNTEIHNSISFIRETNSEKKDV